MLQELSRLGSDNQPVALEMLIKQIEKDFGWFGLKIDLSVGMENVYKSLLEQIVQHIKGLLKQDTTRFFQLMYRIDVNEALLRSKLGITERADQELEIAKLIIEKEANKVLWRLFHSGKIERP